MSRQFINKLVVVGVGLIGGSFALGLRKAERVGHVVGVGRGQANLERALHLGLIDEASTDVASAVQGADLVILAMPVGQMAEVMQSIRPALPLHALISDVGSTKQDVVTMAKAHLGEHLPRFVPAHPIAGAEQSGAQAARFGLFENKNVVLTPLPATQTQAVDMMSDLWQTCGARLSLMSPSEHDQIFAAVSHLPHLLAFALVDDIVHKPNADQCFKYAASGFRDFTRIASSHPEMWRDISLANREALLKALAAYQDQLTRVQTMLAAHDAEGLQKMFDVARTARNAWLDGLK
ncbi:prephenate dehydrogenase/arogenate dehydrogenase family protein [Chitinivorax sp. B]|uniref:prephenate dehydrogenase n=1 Tax=Chitinivorax sp. B TaxID=2502235 RepID=UPI00201728CB|nr:prephenate dehydrogenase/arogenate dehydrogenase family protein [Chitinivorax sp. B]